jgi:hypothetical protein
MMKGKRVAFLVAAIFAGFGVTQAAAQPSVPTNAGDASMQGFDPSGNGDYGSHWIRPECLQPNVQTYPHRSVVWVRKPQCQY